MSIDGFKALGHVHTHSGARIEELAKSFKDMNSILTAQEIRRVVFYENPEELAKEIIDTRHLRIFKELGS